MHHIERNVGRTIKGVEKKVDLLFVVGRLTVDPPEIREVNGTKVVSGGRLAIAVKTGKESTEFYNISAWGSNAENFARLCFKGQLISIVGVLTENSYQHQGETRTSKDVTLDKFTVLEYKKDGNGSQPQGNANTAPQGNSNPTPPAKESSTQGSAPITPPANDPTALVNPVEDDDIPF